MTSAHELIRSIPSGVLGFDTVLGGGIPEYSLNLVVGGPGAGKTTLAHQIAFASATPERPALYLTVLGEPAVKLLRYQSQFRFFDAKRVGSAVHYANLSDEILAGPVDLVLERIQEEVERHAPQIIVVDSFRPVSERAAASESDGGMDLESFVQRLALHLSTWEATSFLIGEFADGHHRHPVFTVADGVFWLSQVTDRNSVVRKLQVVKVRGRAHMPGLHTFRITEGGLQIFPRIPEQQLARKAPSPKRQATGVPGLDEVMGGGIPAGDAVMLAGPAGSGKTTFATQFIAEGLRSGDSVVVCVFEEYPEEYLKRARGRNYPIEELTDAKRLKLIYLRPLDLSVDETLAEILAAVQAVGAERVVIDSLSGFEIALAPAFRDDFRESLYRLVGALTGAGVTVLMTAEITGEYPESRLTTERISFISDDIIVQRFVEVDGELRKVLSIMKMRGSAHSQDLRTYEITANGAVVGGALTGYQGIMTGSPDRIETGSPLPYRGLTEREIGVLETLARLGTASFAVLRTRTGVEEKALAPALDRIVALGYGTARTIDGELVYAVTRRPGS